MIRAMERLRMASDVRWPKPERVAAKLVDPMHALTRARRRRARRYLSAIATLPPCAHPTLTT
jgi:hypothetical protein